jgi:hypothetical protein
MFLILLITVYCLLFASPVVAVDYTCSDTLTRPAADEPQTTPAPKKITISGLSNDFVFNYQKYFATNNLTCSASKVKRNFFSLEKGVGVALRTTPSSKIDFYRTLLIIQVANSEANNTQLNTDCQPVTLSEIFYALRNDKIYKSNNGSKTTLPASIVESLSKKVTSTPLSLDTYRLLFRQLNFIPDKPITDTVIVDGLPKDRDIPGGYSVASTQGQAITGLINSKVKSQNSSTDFCQANVSNSIFSSAPAPISFSLFGNSESNTSQIDYKISQSFADGTVAATNVFSNLLPQKIAKQYSSIPFSSKTSENEDTPVVDIGYRADQINQDLSKLLHSGIIK